MTFQDPIIYDHVCMCAYAYVCVMYVMYVCMYVCMYVFYVQMDGWVDICMYVCMYRWMEKQTMHTYEVLESYYDDHMTWMDAWT